jgi:hypothetical protein
MVYNKRLENAQNQRQLPLNLPIISQFALCCVNLKRTHKFDTIVVADDLPIDYGKFIFFVQLI